MLKKIGHISFAFFMMIPLMGITISRHYCGDRLQSVSVVMEAQSCCDVPMGCCHNEEVIIKIQDDFSPVAYDFDFQQWAFVIPVLITFFEEPKETTTQQVYVDYSLPPPKIQTVLSQFQQYLL